ncbi:Nucleic acid-binding, OB-fold [Sesbania bispinosa]|nr:Nucleic acid-binding, OB-fold [Sesbania bispinosa]
MALVSGAFYMISSLCGRRQSWRLRVKLVRAWNMCSLAKPDDPFALEMVFIDEEATVAKQHMMRFAQDVVEGQVYRLTNFGLTANSGKFRAAAHEFKLVFNAGTRLIPCHSVPIPLSGLSLVKSSEIKETNGCSNFLLDFMGVLTAVSEEINMKKQGWETRLMLLDLVDEMCAIFGDMVDVVAGFINVPRSGLPVVIIQFAKINTYKGVVGIQNVMNAYKISWNPDLPEVIEFKNGLAVHEIETDVSIGFISDRSRHDGCFIVMGIIEEVILEENWWYFACSCMKALSFDLVKEDQGVAMGIDFHDDGGLPMAVATRFRLVDWEPRIVEAMITLLPVEQARDLLFTHV